jgi:hypothetical protein
MIWDKFWHEFGTNAWVTARDLAILSTSFHVPSLLKPCITLFINTPLIWKMYKGIRNMGELKGHQVCTN